MQNNFQNSSTMNLTKTEYLLFLKHRAWLWLKKFAKETLPPIDANTQAVFDAGNRLEDYAEKLFPEGFRIGFNSYDEYLTLSLRTVNAISDGHKVLFQARFDVGNLTCLTDIVEFTSPKKLRLYEVKSSTKVKPEHEYDLAFQAHVLENSGFEVEKISVIHVNKSYIRSGDVDPKQLLVIVDVTEAVREKCDVTNENIRGALEVISSKEMPDISPRHCHLNSMSDWLPIFRCIKEIPEYSIYDLSIPSAQLIGDLEDQNILLMKDIPDSVKLTEKQLAQVHAVKEQHQIIDRDGIKTFLDGLTYPLYFLDYETCADVVPPYDRTTPYQQVPCQYSLHILDTPTGNLRHTEYIHKTPELPIQSLASALQNDIGNKGSVIVWYAKFETTRNNEMAEILPEYRKFFIDLNDRVVDLMSPFSEGMFVDPAFMGSASIKKVLPVVVPELSYKTLTIQEGQTAQRLWMQAVLADMGTDDEKEKLFQDLLRYCELDTLAMVRIYEKLRELTKNKAETKQTALF
jgi:hypothetical protein